MDQVGHCDKFIANEINNICENVLNHEKHATV